AAGDGEGGAARYQHGDGALLAGREPREPEPPRPVRSVPSGARRELPSVRSGRCLGAETRGLRFATLVGNAVRCRGTLPCRRLPEPTSWRRRVASLDEGRPHHREHRFGALVRLRAHACADAGGLAGDAGILDRFPPEARRLLRSEPGPGSAAAERLTVS